MARSAKDTARSAAAKAKNAVDENVHRSAAGGAVWKILSVGTTLIATKVATDVARRSWKIATGRHVPVRGDFDHERARDVVLFTALSSMLVSSARVAAERGVAAYYRQSTGRLPQALEEEKLTPEDLRAHRRLERRKTRAAYRLQKAINRAAPRH